MFDIKNKIHSNPMEGNDYFRGAGKHLPGGHPEMVIKSISTKDSSIVNIILKVKVKQMKNPLKDKVIVIDIAGDFSLVKTENLEMISKLINLGFRLNENGFFEKLNHTQDERLANIKKLINIGALFSSGKDWSPEELMNYYSELGLLKEPYNIISWKSQNEYRVRSILNY